MSTITAHRKSPRSKTIGVNRDGQPIGLITLIPGTTRWSARAYTVAVPYERLVGDFATEQDAIASIAKVGETPVHLERR